MSDVILSGTMSDSEKKAFLASLRETESGLKKARDLLSERKALSSDDAELQLIRIERGDIISKLTKLQARRQAFLSGTLSLKPPSSTVVADIKQRAAALDGMIASATAAKTVVDTASSLVSAINSSLTEPI